MEAAKTRPSTKILYDNIRKAYKSWCNKKHNGIKIYTDAFIYEKLGEQFYKSPRTIENIVHSRV